MASSILSEIEWDDGLAFPISNDENKLLEDEVRKVFLICANLLI